MPFAVSPLVYLATSDVEPEWEDEYNRWYDQEHLPNLRRGLTPGRWKRLDSEWKRLGHVGRLVLPGAR